MSLKQSIRSFAFNVLYYPMLYKLFTPLYSGMGSILMFHRIVKDKGNLRIGRNTELEITEKYLEEIIQYLQKENYEFISLDELHNRLKDPNLKQKRKFICITFDDGYLDNYTLAYPILKKHNIPFAIYIATDFPDKKALLWWYMVEDLVLKEKEIQFEFKEKKHTFITKTTKQKESAYSQIRDLILSSHKSDIKTLVKNLFEPYQIYAEDYANKLAMSWQDVKALSLDPLVTLAAHTVTHTPLSQLKNDEVKSEIQNSVEIIESHINKKIKHFSYPYGHKEAASIREFQIAKEYSFQTSVTTRIANIFPKHSEHLESLPRLPVSGYNESLHWIKVLLSGCPSALKYKFKKIILD